MSDNARWCWVEDNLIHCADLTPGTDPMFATNYFTDDERNQLLVQVLAEAVPEGDEWKGPDFVNTTLCLFQKWVSREMELMPWNQRSGLVCQKWKVCTDCEAHQEYYCE